MASTSKILPLDLSGISIGNKCKFEHTVRCCKNDFTSIQLDKHSEEFLLKLQQYWNMLNESATLAILIRDFFDSCENPFLDALKCIFNCRQFPSVKSVSLPFFIIKELQKWSIANKQKSASDVNAGLKLVAFQVATTKQTSQLFIKRIIDTYQLASNSDVLHPSIRCLIERGNYKEACFCAFSLKIEGQFSIEDFIVPLLLQDRLICAEEFFSAGNRQLIALMTWLDSFLKQPSSDETLLNYATKRGIQNVRPAKLYIEPMKKLLIRLAITYNIAASVTPNFTKFKDTETLRFLISKKYNEHNIVDKVWRQMVSETVKADQNLHVELIKNCSSNGDLKEAQYWIDSLKVDKKKLPKDLLSAINTYSLPASATSYRAESAVIDAYISVIDNTNNYQLFPLSKITVVDTKQKFQKLLCEQPFLNVPMIGIDCEWKPIFAKYQSINLAVVQVATKERAYIFDVHTLKERNVEAEWKLLNRVLLEDDNILKLVFGFSNDLAAIKNSLPHLNFASTHCRILDLQPLWRQLCRNGLKISLPYPASNYDGFGLQELVYQCTGRHLDKSEQMSNWEERPLRKTQLMYAALDAVCLVQVYHVLNACFESAGVNFQQWCLTVFKSQNANKKGKKAAKKTAVVTNGYHISTNVGAQSVVRSLEKLVRSYELKVVCDTMVLGLGKRLQQIGFNTEMLHNMDDHHQCVHYYLTENRYILTRGAVFKELRRFVPNEYCLQIISDNVEQQLREVLNYFTALINNGYIY